MTDWTEHFLQIDIWAILGVGAYLARREFNRIDANIRDVKHHQDELRKELKNGLTERLFNIDKKVGEIDVKCNERHNPRL